MSEKQVTQIFQKRDPKKHSVRFDSQDSTPAVQSIYISNAADQKLGSPSSITITIQPTK